jgi:hypothetical protein
LFGLFKSQDVFGESVHFTFKGKSHFKTAYGAFFSILIKIIMVIFIIYEIYIIVTRKHPAVSIKEVLNNMDDTHGGMAPFHYGFDIAVGLLATKESKNSYVNSSSSPHRRILGGVTPSPASSTSSIVPEEKTYKSAHYESVVEKIEVIEAE